MTCLLSAVLSRVVRAAVVGLALLAAPTALAQQEVDLHDLTWFVHADLINPGAGEDLSYWTNVVNDAVSRGNRLLEGRNGPTDTPCCTKLSTVSVSVFGTPGDGLDVIENATEQGQLANIGLPGSRAFLVDSLTWCNGSSPTAIGCALRPGCSGIDTDDPNLWMYVTVESFDDGTLPSVIAHERAHNACLQHVSTAKCSLMQATVFTPGLGGCLTATECTNIRNARTENGSGEFCTCQDAQGAPLADGTKCDDAGGVCSGGCCGSITGDAGVHLIAAADPGDAGLAPEDALRISGRTGDWTNLGQISPTADDVRAMAYAFDSGVLYGIVPTVGDDRVITMDPTTGSFLSVIGSIGNGAQEIVSMAYDPGSTPSPTDDRLIVLEVDGGSITSEFRAIDPDTPSAATLLGTTFGNYEGTALDPTRFTGMAFDNGRDKLYLSSPYLDGIWETDMSNCPPSPCNASPWQTPAVLFRDGASLAFSPDTGMLYMIGDSFQSPNTRTFYDVIDPATQRSVETLSLDRFTPAGLAAVPEPGLALGLALGAAALATARRRRA